MPHVIIMTGLKIFWVVITAASRRKDRRERNRTQNTHEFARNKIVMVRRGKWEGGPQLQKVTLDPSLDFTRKLQACQRVDYGPAEKWLLRKTMRTRRPRRAERNVS